MPHVQVPLRCHHSDMLSALLLSLLVSASGAAAAPAVDTTSLLQLLRPVVSQCAAVISTVRPLLEPPPQQQWLQLPPWSALAEPSTAPEPLRQTLDQVSEQVAALSARVEAAGAAELRSQPQVQCEEKPTVLPPDNVHAAPTSRACARSCLQLRNQASEQLQDGVYWLRDLPVPVFCDFSHDGGGWTLLLTASTKDGWDVMSARGRNESAPSLSSDYSILRHADTVRDLGNGPYFAYRIEANAGEGRQRWGGVWFAPRAYSFVHMSASQTDVYLVRRFNTWTYHDQGIEKRMPWLNAVVQESPFVLSTTSNTANNWWGTLVSGSGSTFHHSPWIHPAAEQSGTVLYWMREEIQ